MSNKIKGIILVALSAASFGFLPIFAKLAYASGCSSYTLLFLRFLTASCFMFGLIKFKKLDLPDFKDILAYFMLGAIFYVGQSLCYFTALNYASSSVVCILFYTYPTLVMLGSIFLFKEKITKNKVIALVLATIGAFIVAGGSYNASITGIALSILCSFVYCAYILLSSRIVKPGQSIQSSAFIMSGSAVVYGLYNFFFGFNPPDQSWGYMIVLLIALVSTVIAFTCFFKGMELTDPTTTSLVSTLEIVVTVLASWIILKEAITFSILIGGVLIIASLILTLVN